LGQSEAYALDQSEASCQKHPFENLFLAGLVHGENEATKVKEIMSKLHGDDPHERLRWAQPTQFYRLRRYRFKNWYKVFRKRIYSLLAVSANQN